MRLRTALVLIVPVMVAIAVLRPEAGHGAVAQSGYFAGHDFHPMEGASLELLGREPAAVLIFALEAGTSEITAKFDKWYQDPDRPGVTVYAIAASPETTSYVLAEEVLTQRGLKVPAFYVRGKALLNGKEYRLLLLDRGGNVRRSFSTLDLSALETELGFARSKTATDVGSSAVQTIQNALKSDSNSARQGSGGESELLTAPVYHNQRFEMTIGFPPGWGYRVSKNGDGAVARSPIGQLDLRVWGLANTEGQEPQSPADYIDSFTRSLGQKYQSQVTVERRLVVEDEDAKGRDYVYSYLRPSEPGQEGSRKSRYRGRIQVFSQGGVLKAAAAEASVSEFSAAEGPIIEPFFLSFHPRIENVDTDQAPVRGSAGTVVTPGSATDSPPPGTSY